MTAVDVDEVRTCEVALTPIECGSGPMAVQTVAALAVRGDREMALLSVQYGFAVRARAHIRDAVAHYAGTTRHRSAPPSDQCAALCGLVAAPELAEFLYDAMPVRDLDPWLKHVADNHDNQAISAVVHAVDAGRGDPGRDSHALASKHATLPSTHCSEPLDICTGNGINEIVGRIPMTMRKFDALADSAVERTAIDTSRPHPVRRYDYWLGGKDNFAADRESADRIAKVFPQIRTVARKNLVISGQRRFHLTSEVIGRHPVTVWDDPNLDVSSEAVEIANQRAVAVDGLAALGTRSEQFVDAVIRGQR